MSNAGILLFITGLYGTGLSASFRKNSKLDVATYYNRYQLVLQQLCIDGFSWPVSIQGKARLVANGHSPLQEV
jgi:hypothetical protein